MQYRLSGTLYGGERIKIVYDWKLSRRLKSIQYSRVVSKMLVSSYNHLTRVMARGNVIGVKDG